ncbi:MAG: hypothetical protein ACWGMZ_12295 [Thermoguttaceae bacterium]
MNLHFPRRRFLLPVLCLLLGLCLGGVLPHTPLHAVATDRSESYLIATGLLDSDVEAVFLLDCLTGDLTAAVLGKNTGGFTSLFRYNVLKDLQVDQSKNPHFLMVTGLVDLRGGYRNNYGGASVVYVAETTGGRIAAYAVPWDRARWNSHVPVQDMLRLVGIMPVRNTPSIMTPKKPY